jgi:hypothetical protein
MTDPTGARGRGRSTRATVKQRVPRKQKQRLSYVEALWAESFQRLREFKEAHGHCNVPAKYSKNPALADWVIDQRVYYHRGTLDLQRERKLTRIGFDWDPRETRWQIWLKKLRAFRDAHGHSVVPLRWPESPELATWVQRQRMQYHRGSLLAHRRQALEAIGFSWGPLDEFWEELFERLHAFKKLHRHCDVPHLWEEDRQLGVWVAQQRRQGRAGTLDPERKERLSALGFVWKLRDAGDRVGWDAMFERLRNFRKARGNLRVPADCAEDPALGRWVTTQRRLKATGTLDAVRKGKLEALRFEWDAWAALWDEMYARLERYQRTHGNSRVPQGYGADPALGNWVATQRRQLRAGKLSTVQRKKLKRLGFEESRR